MSVPPTNFFVKKKRLARKIISEWQIIFEWHIDSGKWGGS